jgi:hypothetical protein
MTRQRRDRLQHSLGAARARACIAERSKITGKQHIPDQLKLLGAASEKQQNALHHVGARRKILRALVLMAL